MRKFWAVLQDISHQLEWPVNGSLTRLHREDWRFIICAALMKETRVAEGIEGGHVVLGLRLRDIFAGLSPEDAKRRASDLIELATMFAHAHGVKLSDPEEVAAREQYQSMEVVR
jgi:hypothetical protein